MPDRSVFSFVKAMFPRINVGIYLAELSRALEGCRTVLDIGCGGASPLRHLGIEHLVGVDAHAPTLEEAKRAGTHREFHLVDVRQVGAYFQERRFDACVALDLIEHLIKADGISLIRDMEKLAVKRIVVFTPNGFLPQVSPEGELQEHLSGWVPADMNDLGFRVIGMLGPKLLRGEYHEWRYLPRAVASPLAAISHYAYTRAHPTSAAAMLCVKRLEP